ncbi:hypothetical protein L6164_001447 [Bauhinia variegata]|uniref:Uncharacterized protein n=1 Tax=Bauhinia variegata TaxID=167791 RepID=A0ACB9QAY3_BAUVA|nr:hypothetical protein L6164_001447 [Bauhinia variegata]
MLSKVRSYYYTTTPLAKYGMERGFSSDLIFTLNRLESSRFLFIEDAFLSNLKDLQPKLCITAAYGKIFPNKFLNVPPLGTVNTHLSCHYTVVLCLFKELYRVVSRKLKYHRLLFIASEVFQVDDQIKECLSFCATKDLIF